MIDWSFPPELQQKYDEIVARTRRLQQELGITPMTLEERAIAGEKKRHEAEKRQKEIEEMQRIINSRRPLPKWKV